MVPHVLCGRRGKEAVSWSGVLQPGSRPWEIGEGRSCLRRCAMASFEPKGKPGKFLPVVQEGETVLTFQGPKMRLAQCIWVTMEDKQVKYLVRYPPETQIRPAWDGIGTYPIANVWPPLLELSQPAARDPSVWPNSRRGRGRALALASFGRGGFSQFPSLGRGGIGSNILAPMPVVPQVFTSEPLCPVAPHGWFYEWLPEGNVLRYSIAYLQEDRYAYVLLQMAAERRQQEITRPLIPPAEGNLCPLGENTIFQGAPGGSNFQRGRARSRGRRGRASREKEASGEAEKESLGRKVQVQLPSTLTPLLMRDWEMVTLQKKLFTLPARKTISVILSEYATFHPEAWSTDKKHAVCGLVAVIKEYFELVLGTQMLYKFERPQYAEILARYPRTQMTQVYGGSHLLRLFTKLGSMVSSTSLDDKNVQMLMGHFGDLLEYLGSNPSLLCITPADYQMTTKEYQEKAE